MAEGRADSKVRHGHDRRTKALGSLRPMVVFADRTMRFPLTRTRNGSASQSRGGWSNDAEGEQLGAMRRDREATTEERIAAASRRAPEAWERGLDCNLCDVS
jgi:hypothetical protein